MGFNGLAEAERRRLLAEPWTGALTEGPPAKGNAGEVFFIRQRGDAAPGLAAKVPNSNHGAAEDAKAFIREIEFQRTLAWHQCVNWPFRTAWIHDTPIAWFRRWDGDLVHRLDDPTFTVPGRIAFLIYLADALAHCHIRGLDAHQDLKPENILLRDRGAEVPPATAEVLVLPMVADLGSANLARLIGEFGGTRAYMAPEQWREEPLSSATSAWSIGVIGYELLSNGIHPLGRRIRNASGRISVANNVFRARAGAFNPPENLADADLDALFRRCMAVVPTDRPNLGAISARLLEKLDEVGPLFRLQVELILGNPYGSTPNTWPAFEAEFEQVKRLAVDRFGPTMIEVPVRRAPLTVPP